MYFISTGEVQVITDEYADDLYYGLQITTRHIDKHVIREIAAVINKGFQAPLFLTLACHNPTAGEWFLRTTELLVCTPTHISLEGFRINSLLGADLLHDSNKLRLSRCTIDKGAFSRHSVLRLSLLALRDCQIETIDWVSLARTDWVCLKHLDVTETRLDNAAASAVAGIIKRAPNIEFISLRGCHLSDVFMEALASAVHSVSSRQTRPRRNITVVTASNPVTAAGERLWLFWRGQGYITHTEQAFLVLAIVHARLPRPINPPIRRIPNELLRELYSCLF